MKQFLTITEASEQLGVSKQYIRMLITGIRKNTPNRYFESDIFGGGKIAVRFVALQDYAKYRDSIETAPPYEPVMREAELGISGFAPNGVTARELMSEFTVALMKHMGYGTI